MNETMEQTTQDEQMNAHFVFGVDHYIEGVWLAVDVVSNDSGDDEDRTGDGTHRLVATVPRGWDIIRELLAMIYRNGNEWRFTARLRYWGGVDGAGVNDALSSVSTCVGQRTPDEIAEIVSTIDEILARAEQNCNGADVLHPVKYHTVQGNYDRYSEVMLQAGHRLTASGGRAA